MKLCYIVSRRRSNWTLVVFRVCGIHWRFLSTNIYRNKISGYFFEADMGKRQRSLEEWIRPRQHSIGRIKIYPLDFQILNFKPPPSRFSISNFPFRLHSPWCYFFFYSLIIIFGRTKKA